jgi:hypothetical protein
MINDDIDKDVIIISPYHCASTSLLYNIGHILNKNFINDWDKNRFPEKIFRVRKYHFYKEGMESHIRFIRKFEHNKNIIIIPFRKKSKIILSGYLQSINNCIINKNFQKTEDWVNYFKNWIEENKDKAWYNVKYINDLKKRKTQTFAKKKNISHKNFLKYKDKKSTFYILNVNEKINDDFYCEIYKEYYNKDYIGNFISEKINVTKNYFKEKNSRNLDYNKFYNLVYQDIELNNVLTNFDKDYYKIIS